MKKIMMLICLIVFAGVCAVSAVETTKPTTHNSLWTQKHGQAAKVNEMECLSCHEERLDCIACHEDVAPRNHTMSWGQKNHGLESRWNRMDCKVCHREDFCVACHETAVPLSHSRAGFGVSGSPSFHCNTGCQLPVGSWKNTPAKNCITCHQTRPIIQSTGALHALQ